MKSRKYWTGARLGPPDDRHKNVILVAPSNVEGRSGAGVAKLAVDHWSGRYGQARGLSGRAYFLPTKNLNKGYCEVSTGITYNKVGNRSLSVQQIRSNILDLYSCARENPDKLFVVPYTVGAKNLNGYSSEDMWLMFVEGVDVPINIVFHQSFKGRLD